uniref:Oxysterol-binding protein n=1 Tax=Panagrolaimus sp. ES5 TaxID=591445 RepID=A0AC34F5K1_9BILA
MSTSLQNRLRTARHSIANHASRLKKRKKLSRKSTLLSITDPATMLLKAALDQPAIEHAIQPIEMLEYETELDSETEDEATANLSKGLKAKFKELQTCESLIQKDGTELLDALSRELPGGSISRTTLNRLILFKMTAGAMLEASKEFTAATCLEIKNLPQNSSSNSFRDKKKKTIQKENFLHLSNGKPRRHETEDDEFFDAIESSSLVSSDDLSKSTSSNVSTPIPPPSPSERRAIIPYRPSNSINYLTLMKNCIGKDLSRISMPVDFNEPISALQKQTEDLEYSFILDRAVDEDDATKRLALVTIFALSSYSTIGKRTTKPFNPMLGETFDFDRRNDLGWKSVAEQVSHHPPTSALAAESDHGWSLNQSYTFTTKVKGRSLCMTPIGGTYIKFHNTNDLFVYEKVSTSTRMTNIMTGNLQTDNYGELCVKNLTTNSKCILKFHESGYFTKTEPRKVTGEVLDSNGIAKFRIEGSWDKSATLFKIDEEENIEEEEIVWQAAPLPKNAEKMHNFTKFAIELNEMEDGIPPTDSRLRPDQRLMEDGKWSQANEIKQKLEELQRERRKKREEAGIEYEPLWFKRKSSNEMIDQNDVYSFNNEYWQKKEKQEYENIPEIFKLG